MTYRHTQTAPAMYALAAVGVVWIFVWAVSEGGAGLGIWWVVLGLLLVAVGLISGRLTVTVDDASVTSAFGWGWPRRRLDVREIDRVAAVRTRWWYGWGIHKVSGGWLFNNRGRDAVELTLRSGKVFWIGTDQPDELSRVLERAQTA